MLQLVVYAMGPQMSRCTNAEYVQVTLRGVQPRAMQSSARPSLLQAGWCLLRTQWAVTNKRTLRSLAGLLHTQHRWQYLHVRHITY